MIIKMLIVTNLDKKHQGWNVCFTKPEVLNILKDIDKRLEGFKGAFFLHQFYRIILAQFQLMTKVNLPASIQFPGKLIIVLFDCR